MFENKCSFIQNSVNIPTHSSRHILVTCLYIYVRADLPYLMDVVVGSVFTG